MNDKKIKGFNAAKIFLPLLFATTLVNILIIISTISLNFKSKDLTKLSNDSSKCSNSLSSITAHSSKLADTVVTYIYTPIIPTGPDSYTINNEPINQYVSEINDLDKSPDSILNDLNEYKYILSKISVNDDNAYSLVNIVIDNMKHLLSEQARAITILSKKVEVPEYALEAIGNYTLTNEELEYVNSHTIDEVKDYIFTNVLFDKDYSLKKRDLNIYTNNLMSAINEHYNSDQNHLSNQIRILRICLWILLTLILIITAIFFALLYKLIIRPIITFSKKINNNEKLDDNNIMYETNLLATSYNDLLDRHYEFEEKLRMVAEIDSLTGLPNRYCYKEFLNKPHEAENSLCVFLFDINNLKYVNDTLGHKKGDELIINASRCLKECFLNSSGNNCYRIGGDEFVAMIENITENDIKEYIQKFIEYQQKYDVSIAYGYSYTKNISKSDIEKLVINADKKMYRNKKETYQQNNKNDLILKSE